MRWPWRTKRDIEKALPIPDVSPEKWARLSGTIVKAKIANRTIEPAKIVSYEDMDEDSKREWDEHMKAQRERFGE